MNEENTNKNQNTERRLPTQLMLIVRILVGVYLYYSVITLITGGGIAEAEGGTKLFFIAACVVFVIAGTYLIIVSGKALLAGNYEGGKLDFKKNQVEEEEIEWRGSLENDTKEIAENEQTESKISADEKEE